MQIRQNEFDLHLKLKRVIGVSTTLFFFLTYLIRFIRQYKS